MCLKGKKIRNKTYLPKYVGRYWGEEVETMKPQLSEKLLKDRKGESIKRTDKKMEINKKNKLKHISNDKMYKEIKISH